MSTEIEPSALPPLESSQSPKTPDVETSNESTDSENNPQEIKKNILKIYPRLQSLEKNINQIRQQIPSELNKSILQIRKDVLNLKTKSGNQVDANDVLSQLRDLENQMNFKVDLYVDQFSTNFKNKCFSVDKPKPKALLSQLSTSLQNEYGKNLDDILNQFNMNNKSTEKRLSNLEQKITKLTSQSTRFRPSNNIEQMRKSIQKQNIQLSEINTNLNLLMQSSEKENDNSNNPINQRVDLLIQNDSPQSNPEIPDLTEPIKMLSEQIQKFKKDFEKSLDDAKEKAQNCKNHLAEVKETANEISESAKEIESKVIEVNNLCDSLSKQINEITHNLSQNTAQRTIENASAHIKSIQIRILSELLSIKKRLKKCETSESLIKLNLPNNNDDTQSSVVTFGKID